LNPLGHSRPVTGLLYLYLFFLNKVLTIAGRRESLRKETVSKLTMFIASKLLQNTADDKTSGINILCGTAQLHQPQSSKVTPNHGDKHVTDLT
jgi:hypothetical protein